MARDYSGRRYSDKSSTMHLFDFNETLSGKRFQDEKRAVLESQMESLYKARGSNSKPRREDVEVIRNISKKVQGGSEMPAKGYYSNRETDGRQRAPSVVARLMGLDTLPTEKIPVKTVTNDPALPGRQAKKKPVEQIPSKNRKPSAGTGPAFQRDEYYQVASYHAEEKPRFSHPRFVDDRKVNAGKEELPDMHELEEMKRQLALKQMLVREKLNEAKRLLTGEKLSDRKWIAASEKLNQSKEFLDAIDFFQSNRDAFLKYVSDQDSVLGKHIETPGRTPRHADAERPLSEGFRNPIVRKVIEGRREDALRNTPRHSEFGCEDNFRNPVSDNQVATRIVVLKPSPNRHASPAAGSFPPPFPNMVEYPKPEPVARRVAESPREDITSNPREIAKEIARQVRESVVRDLARNASSNVGEAGTEKRLNVTIDNLEGPRLTRGISNDYTRAGAAEGAILTPTRGSKLKKSQLEQVEEPARKSPQLQKRSPRPRQSSGSSPPLTRPVSKGIVVLVPDQSVAARNARVSEASNRDITPSDSGKLARKDRTRRSQQIYLDSTAHKLGDTFRKLRSNHLDEKRTDTNKELTDSKRGDASSCSRPGSSNEVLGYGGSFLLKSTDFESQGENEEASCDHSDTVGSGYTADVCVSDIKSTTPENTRSSSDCVSSCDSAPSEPSTLPISPCEQEIKQAFESVQASPEISIGTDEEVKVVQVSQVEEPIKDSTTTTDSVDVDGTSVSSDNSGQPSPISVLESSFEESPARVDFETISSELEELRHHLRLLKCTADDFDESPSGLEDPVVDKVVVEEVTGNEIEKGALRSQMGPDEDDLLFQLLDLDKYDISDLYCPDGRKEEQIYVKNILVAAGLLGNDGPTFILQHHSQAHALDPLLFERLERYYSPTDVDKQTEKKTTPCKGHRHLFDVVNEILTQRYVCHPWLSTLRAVGCGTVLLAEVWSKLCDFFNYPQGEDLQQTVENLIEKYLSRGDRWMDLRKHVEDIGLELEEAILNELFEETIISLTESD